MEVERLEYLRSKLFSEKIKTLKILDSMDNMEEYANMDNYYNELSQYDNHPGDIGTETFMREQDEGFKNQLKDLLLEIEESFEDIRRGSYGICKICNVEIPSARLEIIPHAKTCSNCSEDKNPNEKMYESIEDEYITKYRNSPDENGYDREDAYQDFLEVDIVSGDPSFSTGDYMGIANEQNKDEMDDIENISQEYYDSTLK